MRDKVGDFQSVCLKAVETAVERRREGNGGGGSVVAHILSTAPLLYVVPLPLLLCWSF